MPRKDFRQAKAEKRAKKTAKNARRQGRQSHDFHPSRALLSGLAEAEQLLNQGAIEESIQILEELARRHPRRLEVLGMLLDAYYQQHDMWSYQSVCQQLTELDPDNVDVWFSWPGWHWRTAKWPPRIGHSVKYSPARLITRRPRTRGKLTMAWRKFC